MNQNDWHRVCARIASIISLAPRSLTVAALCASVVIVAAFAQVPPSQTGSISGTVIDNDNGAPLMGRTVTARFVQGTVESTSQAATTDSQGHYRFTDLRPGIYWLQVKNKDTEESKITEMKLSAGADVTSTDFWLDLYGTLSGTVVDQGKTPVAAAWVLLFLKNYQNGRVTYVPMSQTTTDDVGRFKVSALQGRTYVLTVKAKPQIPPGTTAISLVPDEPEKRQPVLQPTYYPNATFVEGAGTFTLHSGRSYEGLVIQVTRTPGYCVQGVTALSGTPASLSIAIQESDGAIGNAGMAPASFQASPSGLSTGPDGKFRICDLHAGEYTVTVRDGGSGPGTIKNLGLTDVTVADHDLTGLRLSAVPTGPLFVEAVWDGPIPEPAPKTSLAVQLNSARTGSTIAAGQLSSPKRFALPQVSMGDYSMRVFVQAKGAYVKEAMYDGKSVLHRVFRAVPGSELRVVLANDAGSIAVTVVDKDNHAVPSANVWFLPANAESPAALEPVYSQATTDPAGACKSDALPPGKYIVLATTNRLDRDAAHIDKLWDARSKGKEVEIAPNGTAQVRLMPTPVW